MRFAYPQLLVLAALLPLAGFVWTFLRVRREKALRTITMNPPRSRLFGLQSAFMMTGLALAIVAAARPQWGRSVEMHVARSRNVAVAIDVSRSMLAPDVRPNRLERAKADVADLIDSLGEDRCALVDLGHGLKTTYSRDDIAGGLLAFRSGATKIAVEFRELEISVIGQDARVEGWIDYSGTEAAWPRYVPQSEKFLAHLEKTDGQWLFSRIKVP